MTIGKRVTEAEVRAVPEPVFTDTWHPLSHAKFLDAMSDACEEAQIGVIHKSYSLNKSGTRMFGSWTLGEGTNGVRYMIGLRGSIDQTMAKGVCAGTTVMVCSNMMFSGDYVEFRKHTSGLNMDELVELGRRALSGALVETKKLAQWHEGLRDVEVSPDELKVITYNMMEKDVIPVSKFHEFNDGVTEEYSLGGGELSLYVPHGAATRLMRGVSIELATERSERLINVCDDYIEYKKAA